MVVVDGWTLLPVAMGHNDCCVQIRIHLYCMYPYDVCVNQINVCTVFISAKDSVTSRVFVSVVCSTSVKHTQLCLTWC